MSTRSLTCQQSVSKRYHSDGLYSVFYLQDGGKKSTGIYMEQNYVTVTLIYKFALSLNPIKHCALMEFRFAMTHILFTKFFW